MGYTHYWKREKNLKDVPNGAEKFKKAVDLLKKCIEKIPAEFDITVYDWENCGTTLIKVPFKLAGGNGTGEPVFTDDKVCFNGFDDGENDYAHETCYVALDDENYEFDFCKTARKPYDVAVCLTLLCFKHFFGDYFSYSSDGRNDDEGWSLAHTIFNETL